MLISREDAEREAMRALTSGVHGATNPVEFTHTMANRESLFVGQVERHMLRAYCNGLGRCLYELAAEANGRIPVPEAADGSRVPMGFEASDRRYPALALRVQMIQNRWPLGPELQSLLDDYRMQGVRGRALLVDLSAMAVRLSPSLERRLALVQALHQQGRFKAANGQMAGILSRPISHGERAQVWVMQCVLFRERGLERSAHAASRAAVACGGRTPATWASWVLTSCLVGDRRDLLLASREFARLSSRDRRSLDGFRGLYAQRALPAEALDGLPKAAQSLLWECFG